MKREAKNSDNLHDRRSTGNNIKNLLFILVIAIMFTTGIYSLFLASIAAGKVQAFTTDYLFRKAASSDTDKIETAFGHDLDLDFIFLILDTSMQSVDSNLEFAVKNAADILADSGLTTSARILYPTDKDFASIAAQNGLDSFPALLAVKREGGIIQITKDYSQEYLLFAYHSIWGKTSDCSDDKSAVY